MIGEDGNSERREGNSPASRIVPMKDGEEQEEKEERKRRRDSNLHVRIPTFVQQQQHRFVFSVKGGNGSHGSSIVLPSVSTKKNSYSRWRTGNQSEALSWVRKIHPTRRTTMAWLRTEDSVCWIGRVDSMGFIRCARNPNHDFWSFRSHLLIRNAWWECYDLIQKVMNSCYCSRCRFDGQIFCQSSFFG